MVEITHGGNWIKWSSLEPRDRNLVLLSLGTSFLGALPVGAMGGYWGYKAGYKMGSGRAADVLSPAQIVGASTFAIIMLIATALTIVSAIAWWRFSRNQDEMFNRIQNYAIAQGSAWTLAIAFLSWMLSLGGWLPPLPLEAFALGGVILVVAFWYRGVHKWL